MFALATRNCCYSHRWRTRLSKLGLYASVEERKRREKEEQKEKDEKDDEEEEDELALTVSSCERSSSASLKGIKLKVSGRSTGPALPCLMFWMTGSVCGTLPVHDPQSQRSHRSDHVWLWVGTILGEIPAEGGQRWVSSLSHYCAKNIGPCCG